ncbi:hypothetical protein [Hydrogenophaga sp. 5NK40-0174]|uniref:hypothetical protein n=1 Tax=Hydrogenophaga sp. 5NK40-0174 TaxID=3127649 RepID=UPI00334137BE
MIEILTRLGLALALSLGISLLLAWGWDQSDHSAAHAQTTSLADNTSSSEASR